MGLLDFSHKVKDFGLFFCGDSIISWPNFGNNMIGIFCGKPKLDNMWVICVRGPKIIYEAYIWNICGKYLCELKIVYGLVWVYIFVSGLMKLGSKNL